MSLDSRRNLTPLSRKILEAGISRPALATTLPIQGRQDLRDMIQHEQYLTEDGTPKNLIFLSPQDSDVERSVLLLNLVAKEMYLSKMKVVMISMQEVMEDYTQRCVDSTVDYVFLPGFYDPVEGNLTTYGTPQETARIFKTLRFWHYQWNIGIAVFVYGRWEDSTRWWPTSMLEFLRRGSVVATVEANV